MNSEGGIKEELEKLNTTHQGIDANPVTRIRRYVKQFNDKVGKLEVELDIDEAHLAPHQREALESSRREFRNRVTLKVPEWAKKDDREFSAVATHNGRKVNLTLEVRY